MKKKVLLLIFILKNLFIFSQNLNSLEISYINRIVDTLYNIQNVKKDTNFPVFDNYNVQGKSVDFNNTYSCVLKQKEGIEKSKQYKLCFMLYSKGIDEIYLNFKNENNGEVFNIIKLPIPNEGYLYPTEIPISNKIISQLAKKFILDIKFLNKKKEQHVEIKNLFIGSVDVEKKIGLPLRIFEKDSSLFFFQRRNNSYNKFDSYGMYSNFPNKEREEEYKGVMTVSNEKGEMGIEGLVLFVNHLLEVYPFYNFKKINKKKILEKYDYQFVGGKYNSNELCKLIDDINFFLKNNLSDGHFFIRNPKKCSSKIYNQIKIKSIKDNFYVAANFDPNLSKKITPGSKIIKINNKFITNSDQINYPINDSIDLEFETKKGNKKKVKYKVLKKYKVPDNFLSKNLEKKILRKNSIYYKINKINHDLVFDFLNNIEIFNRKKNIIFDLRNCSGGDFIALSQFLSYFIQEEFQLYQSKSFINSSTESFLVKSNESVYSIDNNVDVSILVNEKTACAAEMMCYVLKEKRKNVSIYGSSKTSGNLSLAPYFKFEELGLTVISNAYSTGKILMGKNKIDLEIEKIKPDYLVHIESVSDLKPYKDKVLKTALRNIKR